MVVDGAKDRICADQLVGGIFENRLDGWLLLMDGIGVDQLVGGIFANRLDGWLLCKGWDMCRTTSWWNIWKPTRWLVIVDG